MTALKARVVAAVADIDAAAWDALVPPDDPFIEHRFLAALERSGSTGVAAGCVPRFVLVERGRDLVGACPLYLKDHSYGEFIFDWSWAGAAERAGVAYYPKLVAAVPYTPVTGARLLVRADESFDDVADVIARRTRALADETGASSVHVLFCRPDEKDWLAAHDFAPRLSFQFHWKNRTPQPYATFDDFLGTFRAEARKQVRKERRVAAAHEGLTLVTRAGPELADRDWAALERFYLANAEKHDAMTYLRPRFFAELRGPLADRVVATLALRGGEPVAGALNFERGRHLYGRYWGCLEEHAMLHFELCYYALIERAIARGHTLFEAGAQGEHKLKRGLLPDETWSAHWIRHPGLARAIEGFCAREAVAVREQIDIYNAHAPVRRGPEGG